MSTPAPICVDCHVEMRCIKNHTLVRDVAISGFPSTYWIADQFQCQGCHHRIVIGFARKQFLEEELLKTHSPHEVQAAIPFVHNHSQLHLLQEEPTSEFKVKEIIPVKAEPQKES